MIRKLIRQMLAAQIVSALTVSLCLLIDSIMISRFLGRRAIAAYGFANPLLLAIGAIGTLLASGIQVVCSKALGRGDQEEANIGYSSAVTAAAAASLLFVAAVFAGSGHLSRLLGTVTGSEEYRMTKDYLIGFSIGAPGSIGALVLVPFLQMAGQSNLLIAAVMVMTVTDIGLDLLNVFVLEWGMFGMGLASALSYYAALIVGGFYLLSKKSVFRFSRKRVKKEMISELFCSGIPAGVNMLASVVLVYLMNQILKNMHGSFSVAAYTVILSIGNAANCITTGIGGVSLTLSGVFFHEEDRSALRETVSVLCLRGVMLGLGMCALLLIFAPQMIGLFLPEPGRTQETAIRGLRLFGVGLIPCCINNALKYHYQASGRTLLSEGISVLEGAVLPAACAFLLSRFFGTTGAWIGFAAGETLALLLVGLLIRRTTGEHPWKNGSFLLLKKDFGAAQDQILELSLSDVGGVTAAAEKADEFCRERGGNERESNHIALCVEEMAANVIQYGFGKGDKKRHLSVLILNKPDYWVLRFRDDCRAFNPVQYVPREEEQALGIRLVMGITEEAYYTYSMNLNNLLLKVKKELPAAEPFAAPQAAN